MIPARGYAAASAGATMRPYSFERREPGPHDVVIDITHCGVCHTDIHFVRNDWGMSLYPMVPGHEILGIVRTVGRDVRKFKAGDRAGVGCLVDSCRTCEYCSCGSQQFCQGGYTLTYSWPAKDGTGTTQGGYSSCIVVDEDFALKVQGNGVPAALAPLMCAGITTYSPLKRFNVGAGHKLAVVGLGGLGHMAVKLGAALGADVTVVSTSPGKRMDAARLGAHDFIRSNGSDPGSAANRFDVVLNTLSAPHDYGLYLGMAKPGGTMICVGFPPEPIKIPPPNLIFTGKCIAGSLIGGLEETQQMLDFCAANGVTADVEVIQAPDIDEAFERMLKSDVRYRFVIDAASFS